ncbi:MAG: hypothetical protein JKY37_23105 [Nannocystaceae bacterium]|nr:hypothetical protein [Nannocystaceae bacterium]
MSSEHNPEVEPNAAEPTVAESVAAELAALGEGPVSDEELAGIADGRAVGTVEHGMAEHGMVGHGMVGHGMVEHGTVATVATLVSLGQPLSDALVRPLSELELARVYRRVAVRLPAAARGNSGAVTGQGSARSAWTALTVVAAAAAFVLVPVLRRGADPMDTPQGRVHAQQEAAAIGDAARVGLRALGPSGSARTRSLADDYARRMLSLERSPLDGGTP